VLGERLVDVGGVAGAVRDADGHDLGLGAVGGGEGAGAEGRTSSSPKVVPSG
jgi:hypothetical protein